MINKRWNPALRHTILGEPGNDRYLEAMSMRNNPVLGHPSLDRCLGDVRETSADRRYMDGPFIGPMANALKEARNAPEHPVLKSPIPGMSRERYELLTFLRIAPKA